MGNVLDIPGYAAALDREALVRDAAFLPLTETVEGFELRPMTLRDFVTLRIMRSPFIFGTTPTPVDLSRFLWLLSPKNKGGGLRARWHRAMLMKRCRRFVPPPDPAWTSKRIEHRHQVRTAVAVARGARLLLAIQDYIAESLQDLQPHGSPVGAVMVSHFSDAAAVCSRFAREYGWSEESILSMPMKRILQYMKEMRMQSNSDVPLCNPSDKVKSDWMTNLNRTAAPVAFIKPPDGFKVGDE